MRSLNHCNRATKLSQAGFVEHFYGSGIDAFCSYPMHNGETPASLSPATKSIGSGEIEVKQVKDQLPILPKHAKSAIAHTAADGYDSTFTYPEREYAVTAKRKSVQLRLEPPACIPGVPVLPRAPWNRPIHVAAGRPMGRRARGILLQDNQARAGERQGLQDEGGGEAGRARIHRALLQQAKDALIDRP